MKRMIWDVLKIAIIFITCTCLFYFGMRMMHAEYEQYHRYDPPEGNAVKVFHSEETFLERLNVFFRLGE